MSERFRLVGGALDGSRCYALEQSSGFGND